MFEQKVEVAMTSLGIENDRLHPAVQRLALELVARGRQVSNHPYTTPIPPLYHQPQYTPLYPLQASSNYGQQCSHRDVLKDKKGVEHAGGFEWKMAVAVRMCSEAYCVC